MLAVIFFHLALLTSSSATTLYGTTLVPSSSTCDGAKSGCTQLVSLEAATGTLTNIGAGHAFLDGLNDLGVVVGDLYYALGAGWKGGSNAGPTLVALSLKDGSMVCSASAPEFHTIQSIGGGQSLVHDAKNQRLLLAGLNASSTRAPHVLLSAPLTGAPGSCGPFTALGSYGEGGPAPFAMQHHGSSLDEAGQRMFATMLTPLGQEGVGVIDVSGTTANLTAIYPMDGHPGHHQVLYGPKFLAGGAGGSGLLVGAFDHAFQSPKPGQGIDWNTLDPATGAWTNAPLQYASGVPTFDGLLGAGVLRAFDAASSTLYVVAWRGEEVKANMELVSIDARSGTMTAHSGPLNGDLGWAYTILQNMALPSV